MKIFFKIFLCSLLLVSLKLSAQLDTLNYLKQFEANKIEYVNQPFSKLVNAMTQIQPVSVWAGINAKNINATPFSRFKFCEMDESFSGNIILVVVWQTPLPASETDYYENKNGFFFTNDERNYYGSKLVKDIKVYRSQ
ncbi:MULTISPECIES: hypothetical protein [Chryseobacterium]|uniref:Uncharacterized protein n=1 Tax=Chryseobacterium taihuense TaxID=1141221 RepID=A0A4U8WJT5_9FLAO|nr:MULTISPECIES: hypothetical protein [Chryseobacterium]QQV03644.1 hypothetical protein I6I61_04720 [Chryseobacterium sp. FDAARGOS 1104]VFB03018.1 Uncharacterised protein [Chryseobacterium taihuense]